MHNSLVSIPVTDAESVTGVVSLPDAPGPARETGVIIAHGAGNDRETPLIVTLCTGLAEAGYPALRFNFPYREKGRRAPDPAGRLTLTWQAACSFFLNYRRAGVQRIVAAGKSMGGRIASQMAADGILAAEGLVLLGYPLHPAGKKDRKRAAHLPHVRIPMLFFAGTRDALCDLKSLRQVLTNLRAPWELMVIEGGDHSFRLPKSAGTDQAPTFDRMLRKTVSWLDR